MIKFNSVYSKLFLNLKVNRSSSNLNFFGAGALNKLNNTSEFNKFSFKNFYFQESKHGAGDVRMKKYLNYQL
jgi:hypothetical protein